MYSGGDAAADFSGGGFMPTQPSGLTADSTFSRKSGTPNSGLFPLTVKQISRALTTAADDNLVVDGQDISNVTLVGMLFNKEERMTDISFVLDDGTGRVEVKRWIESPDAPEALQLHNMQHGAYIRVHGHLRTFQNKRTIVAFSVRPITDYNEITFHFLECIYVHLQNTKSHTQTGNPIAQASAYANQPATNSYAAPPNGQSNPYSNPYAAPPAPSAHSNNNMNECERRVHAVFEEPASLRIEQGLHIDEVARRCSGFSRKQVKDAVEFLVNEGHIYSTIDDDHYKSTNA